MEIIQRGSSEKEPEQSPGFEPTIARGRRGVVILGDDASISRTRSIHVPSSGKTEGFWEVFDGRIIQYSHFPTRSSI